jgi:integrase
MHPEVQQVLSQRRAGLAKVVRDGQAVPKAAHVFTGPDGLPLKADRVTHKFARVVRKAGIPHCTLHDLRRSFSTLAQRAGVDRETVKDLGGWSVVSVVERHYTGDISAAYRSAMDRIAETA